LKNKDVHPSYAQCRTGWATRCARSPLRAHPSHVLPGDGWGPAPRGDLGTPGYEYALGAGSVRSGFRGVASKTYYKRYRRPLSLLEELAKALSDNEKKS